MARLPVARFVQVGAVAGAVLGGLVGLVLGLRANPPTAWAAVFEVGLPATLAGALLGLAAGGLASLVRGVRR